MKQITSASARTSMPPAIKKSAQFRKNPTDGTKSRIAQRIQITSQNEICKQQEGFTRNYANEQKLLYILEKTTMRENIPQHTLTVNSNIFEYYQLTPMTRIDSLFAYIMRISLLSFAHFLQREIILRPYSFKIVNRHNCLHSLLNQYESTSNVSPISTMQTQQMAAQTIMPT